MVQPVPMLVAQPLTTYFNGTGNAVLVGAEVPNGNGGNTFATNAIAGGVNYTVEVTDNTTGCKE